MVGTTGCRHEKKSSPSLIQEPKNLVLSHKDSLSIIEGCLIRVLETDTYPDDFFKGPLKIMPSKYVRIDTQLRVEGYKYHLELATPDIESRLRKTTMYHYEPFLEIWEFKVDGRKIKTKFIFRSIGTAFDCISDENLKVDSVHAYQI